MRKKEIIILAVAAIIALIFGIWLWNLPQENNEEATAITSDIILFYGKECPHCRDLEKFLEDNKIPEKVKFDSLEVWHNKKNAEILAQKMEECGFDKSKAGVPFLYARGKCFSGALDAQSFFAKEVGI